jgi:hypothetical protein
MASLQDDKYKKLTPTVQYGLEHGRTIIIKHTSLQGVETTFNPRTREYSKEKLGLNNFKAVIPEAFFPSPFPIKYLANNQI